MRRVPRNGALSTRAMGSYPAILEQLLPIPRTAALGSRLAVTLLVAAMLTIGIATGPDLRSNVHTRAASSRGCTFPSATRFARRNAMSAASGKARIP